MCRKCGFNVNNNKPKVTTKYKCCPKCGAYFDNPIIVEGRSKGNRVTYTKLLD